MSFRISNLPLPEPHLALLGLGVLLQALRPVRLPLVGGRIPALGAGMAVGASAVLIGWATRTAGAIDLAEPDQLITNGPYSMTRHPMYEAWTAMYGALTVAFRNGWLAAFFPVLLALVHRDAELEDRRLRDRFGDVHLAYAREVPRYLTVWAWRTWQRGMAHLAATTASRR